MGLDEAGVRRRRRAVVTVLAVLVCALALPALAAAEEFVVDSTGNQEDETPGDLICETGSGTCTLRAAIEEANVPGERDIIEFDEATFGGPGATIVLPESLPAIVESLYVKGTQECEAGATEPCVGLSGPAADPALIVQGTSEVEFERLAISDAEVGIAVENSDSVKVFRSWFGVKLDGSAGPNQTGMLYGPGSDAGRVGTPGAVEEGNVFANNTAVGLDLFGASRALVSGNTFGVQPDGATPAPNGKDIEVTSDASGGTQAVENGIGGRVPSGSLGGPCDRACNVISGSAASGLDLQGDGGAEGPAVATSVVGNYIGLDVAGSAAVANAAAGVRVGAAPQTVIGGPKAGDANRFSGGTAAVSAGVAAADLVVRGNLVGIDGAGGSAPAPDDGLVVNSTGLKSAAFEALLEGNEIAMEGGTAISQQGFGARIADNLISGADVGIRTFGAVGTQGNLIVGNSVADSELDAIRLENAQNEVVGNVVAGAAAGGGAGIAVRGAAPSGIGENVIGGDSTAEENQVGGSAGAAIAIVNVAAPMNTVMRNRGAGNAGLFIDLVPATVGQATGPNGGIAPPSILGATSTGASGTGKPGATVRVFRKLTSLPGEIEGFLGLAKVDIGGNWSLAYAAPIAAGAPIAASQTSETGGTSELALGATGAGEGGGGGVSQAGNAEADAGDRTPPRTAILGGPRARSDSRSARFRFDSDEVGTRFECRLDRKAFRSCGSPKRYAGLRPGRHVFAVRAVDAAGNVDRSPAKRAFTVVVSR